MTKDNNREDGVNRLSSGGYSKFEKEFEKFLD
jgi:hypothetical protein